MQDESKYWDDPESPWSMGMRRHTRKFKWMLVGLAILEAFTGITLLFLLFVMGDRKFFSSSNSILLIIIVSGSMVFPLIMIYRQLRRHRKLVHLIPESKGRLCPICHIAMSSAETNKLNCSRCMRGETIEAIESFWKQYALDAKSLTVSFLKYKSQGKGGLGRFRAELQRRMIESPGFAAGYMIIVFLICGVVFGLFSSQSLLSSILEFAPMMIFMSGFAFIGIGYAKRKGMTRHCAACEYQQAPIGQSPERCPECGADWRVAGAIVQGQTIRTQRHIAIGIAMIIVGLLLIFNPILGSSWKYKILPTNSLIQEAINIRYKNDVWVELGIRPLASEQYDILAGGLLDMRFHEGATSTAGGAWLDAQVTASTMPIDLVARYYEESFELDLTGPARSQIDQTISCDLVAKTRSIRTLAGLKSFVFLGDCFVNGQRIPDSRASWATYLSIIADKEWASVHLYADSVGDLRITRDAWIVIDSALFNGPITWQEDGTPLIPPGVTWQRKITLQHDIEVIE